MHDYVSVLILYIWYSWACIPAKQAGDDFWFHVVFLSFSQETVGLANFIRRERVFICTIWIFANHYRLKCRSVSIRQPAYLFQKFRSVIWCFRGWVIGGFIAYVCLSEEETLSSLSLGLWQRKWSAWLPAGSRKKNAVGLICCGLFAAELAHES